MIRFLRHHPLIIPLATLLTVSSIGTLLIAMRAFLTARGPEAYLVWNLFLAWLPLLLALRLEYAEAQGGGRGWGFWVTAVAWLLFFPNAPYIFTDLTHLTLPMRSRWWTDLILILLFAVTGMVLAFLSLQRIQQLVARRRGMLAGWAFVIGMAFVGAFGVYIGRFERWNSWDVLTNPIALLRDSSNWVHGTSFKFTVLFGLFLSMAYALLYSLASLGRITPGVAGARDSA